jgi:hypothetical protein
MKYACGKCETLTEENRLIHRNDCGLDVCVECSAKMDAAAKAAPPPVPPAPMPAAPPIAICPRCGSTSLAIKNRGFSAGKAAVGGLLLGPLGLLIGAKGSNETIRVCLNCKHEF